jgi:guanosine-3',5'-bis(diphosphate) 3'-pyrophosphohydrolase
LAKKDSTYNLSLEDENKEIKKQYRKLLRSFQREPSKEEKKKIKKAFLVAVDAHKDDRRKTGEPYIYHPLAVAQIVVEEMSLDAISAIAALLHDTVEDTYITLDDIENLFGKKERYLIDGLTKISTTNLQTESRQAENFRKMLLTLSDDVRVILVKLADRLHNMRTLDAMRPDKQLQIASETLFMYAPLAYRLGLNSIKDEMEDLALKYTEADAYKAIEQKLKDTEAKRSKLIASFTKPIIQDLKRNNLNFKVKTRIKSIYSIWNKMQKQKIPFEEVYDLFAIRIILGSEIEREKADCWHAYSIVTDFWKPNTQRLRDWISQPKANGYESLHTTVMGPQGNWTEVQIRTARMDDISEKGYAAHWKYKSSKGEDTGLDQWIAQVREMLESPDSNAIDFIDDFKSNLFSEEIFVFSPKGELIKLPAGASALDFAFEIHSQVGARCTGAKVNNKLVPISHVIKSGDQVEIITSKNQKPKENWLSIVITGKAKAKIKSSLKEDKRTIAVDGKEMLQRKFNHIKVEFESRNITALEKHYQIDSATELYYQIATGKIDLKKLTGYEVDNHTISFVKDKIIPAPRKKKSFSKAEKIEGIMLDDKGANLKYKLAACCSPIAGDQVFGFLTISEGIKIHRTNCPNASQLMSHYGYRVIKATWSGYKEKEFLATIEFTGIDDLGLVNKITSALSKGHSVNMKAISFESKEGIFEGEIRLYVQNTEHLQTLIDSLKELDGIITVDRITEAN